MQRKGAYFTLSNYQCGAHSAAGVKGVKFTGHTGFQEAKSSFAACPRPCKDASDDCEHTPSRIRYSSCESPLLGLARRRDCNGNPSLNEDLVTAGERLKEDLELAQMGPRVAQNWDSFLSCGAVVDAGAATGHWLPGSG